MSFKIQSHSKWDITKIECHTKCNVTQNGMSLKREGHSKLNVTQNVIVTWNTMSLKMGCN